MYTTSPTARLLVNLLTWGLLIYHYSVYGYSDAVCFFCRISSWITRRIWLLANWWRCVHISLAERVRVRLFKWTVVKAGVMGQTAPPKVLCFTTSFWSSWVAFSAKGFLLQLFDFSYFQGKSVEIQKIIVDWRSGAVAITVGSVLRRTILNYVIFIGCWIGWPQ